MDTRTKIVAWDRARAHFSDSPVAIVIGYFDPLLASHARRLSQIRSEFEALISVVLDPPDPILSATARAELLAALESTTYVVIAAPNLNIAAAETFPNVFVFDETASHQGLFENLVEHIRERHRVSVPA